MLPMTSQVSVAEEGRDAGKHHALLCRDAASLEAGSGNDEKKSCCSDWFFIHHDKANSGSRQRSRRNKTAFHQVPSS
jgi:hypothetical protein